METGIPIGRSVSTIFPSFNNESSKSMVPDFAIRTGPQPTRSVTGRFRIGYASEAIAGFEWRHAVDQAAEEKPLGHRPHVNANPDEERELRVDRLPDLKRTNYQRVGIDTDQGDLSALLNANVVARNKIDQFAHGAVIGKFSVRGLDTELAAFLLRFHFQCAKSRWIEQKSLCQTLSSPHRAAAGSSPLLRSCNRRA